MCELESICPFLAKAYKLKFLYFNTVLTKGIISVFTGSCLKLKYAVCGALVGPSWQITINWLANLNAKNNFSQLWGLDVQNQDVDRGVLLPKALGSGESFASCSFWWLPATLQIPSLVFISASLHTRPSWSHSILPGCLCVQISLSFLLKRQQLLD